MSLPAATLAVFASLAVAPTASAESADLSVSGLITPGACILSLSGNGVVDFGIIPADSLSELQDTLLARRSAQFGVQCAAPTRWALTITDNRSGTKNQNTVNSLGLGLTENDEKIGRYLMWIDQNEVVADGAAMRSVRSMNDGETWGIWPAGDLGQPGLLHAFVPAGRTTSFEPVAIGSLAATLHVGPRIAAANSLTVSEVIHLDGSATIELVIL